MLDLFQILYFLQMLTDGLECCWIIFIRLSFWRHPFTAEHPLLGQISPNLMKKQTHPDLRWPESEDISVLVWTIPLTDIRDLCECVVQLFKY